ncbi:hypothetical protein MY04_4247 [Flammeovirga sp. MY04]|uniref:hypothetical protein n=1 Tax=Flammeovirga sp. MY04 TaxID=1191459 RepID=UPI000824B54E|nr:hypothetical protein [Flammeovirga sp. MY04]ANQ51589.2 hypothetical protein MY04_4247 [Flammeovirga sp. MY04]
MNLQEFTPAQTHMILYPRKSKNTDLLKFALFDLLFIDILMIEEEWKYPHPRSQRESLYIYISRGKKYNQYIKRPHQDIFLRPFEEKNRRIQLRKLIKEVLPSCGNGQGYKAIQLNNEFKEFGIFHQLLSLKDFSLFFLNSKGKKLRSQFKTKLDSYNRRLLSRDFSKNELLEILKEIGSNIFLLDNFNSDLIEKMDVNFSNLHITSPMKEVSEYNFAFETAFDMMSISLLMDMDISDTISSSFESGMYLESSNYDSTSFDGFGGDSFDAGGDY